MCFAEQSENLCSCKYSTCIVLFILCVTQICNLKRCPKILAKMLSFYILHNMYDASLYTWTSSSHHRWQSYWASSSMANLVCLTLQVCTSEWNKKTETLNLQYLEHNLFTPCCEAICHLYIYNLKLTNLIPLHPSMTEGSNNFPCIFWSMLCLILCEFYPTELSHDSSAPGGFWPTRFHL